MNKVRISTEIKIFLKYQIEIIGLKNIITEVKKFNRGLITKLNQVK